ncbi:hypothetical protein [Nocardioides limicola]|uniref:hypothetical protein n=1 Tax=Nocardioides limicola TaxID=2803368 RepID=UPI00193BA7D8|nr:hypothetical protein [Nocardioides sp. DJM-14]
MVLTRLTGTFRAAGAVTGASVAVGGAVLTVLGPGVAERGLGVSLVAVGAGIVVGLAHGRSYAGQARVMEVGGGLEFARRAGYLPLRVTLLSGLVGVGLLTPIVMGDEPGLRFARLLPVISLGLLALLIAVIGSTLRGAPGLRLDPGGISVRGLARFASSSIAWRDIDRVEVDASQVLLATRKPFVERGPASLRIPLGAFAWPGDELAAAITFYSRHAGARAQLASAAALDRWKGRPLDA